MKEAEFKRLSALVRMTDGDYATGYRRGLRRLYHGEKFGTEAEHKHWLDLGLTPGDTRAELGNGYRDGFAGRPFHPETSTRHTVHLTPESRDILASMPEDSLSGKINACIEAYAEHREATR